MFLSMNTFGLRILTALINFNEYKYHNSKSIAKIILKINNSNDKNMDHSGMYLATLNVSGESADECQRMIPMINKVYGTVLAQLSISRMMHDW